MKVLPLQVKSEIRLNENSIMKDKDVTFTNKFEILKGALFVKS
jgi:hypothetical protein